MSKINVYAKYQSENKIKYENQRNDCMNFHLKDGLGIEFTAY